MRFLNVYNVGQPRNRVDQNRNRFNISINLKGH